MYIAIHRIKRITQEHPHQLPNGTWVTGLIIKNNEGETKLVLYTDNKKKLIITTSEA